MAWKKKEEEIAPDVAVEKAHEELDRNWLRTPALFWILTSDAGVPHVLQLHQLKIIPGTGTELTKRIPEIPEILKGIWVLLIIDPVDVQTEMVLKVLKEWKDRYERHGVQFFTILRSHIPFYQTPEGLKAYDEDRKFEGILATDPNLLLSKGFGVKDVPSLQLWQGEKCSFKSSGKSWSSDFETKLQDEIRLKDPGIPMLPAIPGSEIKQVQSRNELYFGFGHKGSSLNRAPWKPVHHTITVDGEEVQAILHYEADFGEKGFRFSTEEKASFPPITIKGKWILKESGIFTEDSSAEITWEATYENVSIMASRYSKLELPGRFAMEINKRTPLAQFCSPEARIDDEGHLVLDVRKESFRIAFNKLGKRPGERIVSFKFTQASRIGVGVFFIVQWE